MKFSIIVPVYNVEQYLERCIKSILSQNYYDFEVILVDDGSVDGSGQLCDKYEKMHPNNVVVIHKKNQGVLAARVSGISIAKGDFCVFVDSDDYIEENALETIAVCLSSDSEVDVLIYSFQYIIDGVNVKRSKPLFCNDIVLDSQNKIEIYEKIICSTELNSIWSKAIRTNILKADPTDYAQYYGKNMAEDLLQSLYSITVAKKIMYTTRVLYNYQINNNSISRSFYPETIKNKNTLYVYEKIIEYLSVWNMDSPEVRKRLAARWFDETMYIMSKYYEGATTKENRTSVVTFNWDTFIPIEAYDTDNHYKNKSYQRLYYLWKKGKKRDIERYFWRKKCYQKLRKWKKSLF